MKATDDVSSMVVQNDFCIGCGMCAAICPHKALTMQFNNYGEYIPVIVADKCVRKCGLCLRVCPFWNQEDNEDTLSRAAFASESNICYRPETGYFLDCFAGYSSVGMHRPNGASGGLSTWLLETLIAKGIVDHVICVTHNDDSQKLFRFVTVGTVEEIRQASKSCYYPVELSEVVRGIIAKPGRYAIIGLPCFIKSLRLAMRFTPSLRERILIMAGLVCGQLQSKHSLEYLCALGGGDPACMTNAIFRIKDARRPSSDYGVRFECSSGPVIDGTIFRSQGWNEIWARKYFTPNACNFCDDVFAETADVVFMDGWLPEYEQDSRGTSIVLARTNALRSLLIEGVQTGEVSLDRIDIERAINSQIGVLTNKRINLAYRLDLAARRKGQQSYIPRKRVEPYESRRPDRKLGMLLEERIRLAGREAYARNRPQRSPTEIQQCARWERLAYSSLMNVVKAFSRAVRAVKRLGFWWYV